MRRATREQDTRHKRTAYGYRAYYDRDNSIDCQSQDSKNEVSNHKSNLFLKNGPKGLSAD